MSKRSSYEIDFLKGKDTVSGAAAKIVSAVASAKASASSAIKQVNSELGGQARVLGTHVSHVNGVGSAIENQRQNVKSLSSSYTQAYNEIKQALNNGDMNISEVNASIEFQKQVVADLSAKYRKLKADKNSAGEASKLLQELNDEKDSLMGMRDACDNYKQSSVTLRAQIAQLRNEMAKLRLEGKENTSEYENLRQKMERLGTTYRELHTEETALSTGATQIGGVINGVQGLMGLYSAGSGIVSMFTSNNEKLMQVQTKMQSVMAVMMGIQQASNALHATSAFRIVTCRKVTELWTVAQNRLAVAYGLSTAAAKALLAAQTLGISLIITGAITAISKLISKHRERKKAQEEATKAEEESQKSVRESVANSIASQLVSYRKLQKEWAKLNGNANQQKKFIKDNANEFKNLGVRISSVKDAENLLVSNESAFVESLKRRAMAAAAMELASKKYQSAIEKMLQAEEAKKVTDDDRKNARTYAEGVYQSRVASANGVLGRGQVSGQHDKIVGDAFKSNVYTYGEARAKEYNEAAEKEMKEGDRYFGIVSKYNAQADALLNSGGISSADSGGVSEKAGSIDAIEKKIQALSARMKSASASERLELQKDINAWQKKLDAINLELESISVPADPRTISELDAAIGYYDKLLKVAGEDERNEIQRTINEYKKKKTVIEDSLKALAAPANPQTFEDYSSLIAVLESQLSKASASERVGIQATIDAYKREEDELRARLALATTPAVLESIADYEQAISAAEAALKYANEEERANIQRTINEYRRKKESIEASLDALNVSSEPKSLEDIGMAISVLEAKLQKAGESERTEIQREIDMWKAKKDAIEESLQLVGMEDLSKMVQNGLGVSGELELKLRARITGAEIARQKILELQKMAAVAQTAEEAASIKGAIKQWRQYAVQLGNTQTAGEKATGMLEGMSTIANNMSSIVGENASGWLSWGSNVLSAVAAALPSIASVIGGNIAQAFAGATAQSQTVPFPYNLIALAASLTAVTAAVASIPKYADGGIAYGPTIGMFGEYAGAQHNPEIVAPLDRLKSIIGDTGNGGTVVFRIDGRTLVGVLRKEINKSNRT